MPKDLPPRPIVGGTLNGARLTRYNYWRTGYGDQIFTELKFYVIQAGEYHCKPTYATGSFEHTEHIQLFYHLAGEARLEYAGRQVPLEDGDFFIVPAHYTFTYSGSNELKYHWFAIKGDWPHFLGAPQLHHYRLGSDPEVEAMFVEIREILILRKIGYPLRAIGVFYELMARVEEISGSSSVPESAYPETVRNAIIYLRENYAIPFNSANTANTVGLSASHLRALFEKWLGESPKQFHTRTRIRQAQRLLKEQNLPVSEVAFHVGYGDVHHFSRVFKQITGIAPSQYAAQEHRLSRK